MEFKFSVFFILILVQMALSVPVDKNNKTKDPIAKGDYLEVLKTSEEINKKLKDLLDSLSIKVHLKLDKSSREFMERLGNLIKQDTAFTKAEANDILNHLNSTELKKKLQNIFDELSNIKSVEPSQNLTESSVNLVKQDLANVKAKADDILNHTNLAETKKKLQDLLDALSNTNLVEIYKKFEQQSRSSVEKEISEALTKLDAVLKKINSAETKMKLKVLFEKLSKLKFYEKNINLNEPLLNFFEQELSGVKAKVDAILNQMNPYEIKKKFQDLFKELPSLETCKFYKKFEQELNSTLQEELPDFKAKVDDILKQIDSAETQKKLQDLLYELSILNMKEVTKKFEKRLYNFVDEELPGVKAKIDDILIKINSAKTKQKMQDLLKLLVNIKLAETFTNITERLANLVQQEFTADGKTE